MNDRGLQCISSPNIRNRRLYVFKSSAARGPRAARTCARYAIPRTPTTMESPGKYSSHSAGARRSSIFCSSSPSVTPNDSAVLAYLSAPVSSTKTAESFGVTEGLELQKMEERRAPAEWLEYFPGLSIVVGVLGMAYLAQVLAARGPLAALDLNTYNLLFLMLGLLLHWRPRSFIRAVNNAVPSTAGVLIQFPFYGGIFGIITLSSISRDLAHFFVSFSSTNTYPL